MNSVGYALVTGGAGFIGAALSTYLADHYSRVVAVDNLLPQVHPTQEPAYGFDSRVELLVQDIRDDDGWDRLLDQYGAPDVVVHLAAETGTGQSLECSTRHTSVNVVGTSAMLDAFTRHSVVPNRFVLCSSRAVYGEGAWRYVEGDKSGELFYPGMRTKTMFEAQQWDFAHAEPVAMNGECVERRPESVYGVTKSAQEDLIKIWCDAFGSEVVILRLQNVYGVGQTPDNPYTGIMSIFSKIAQAGQQIQLYEDGDVRRDFVNIDDVRDACIAALEVESVPSHPIDIGSGRYTTIAEAAQIIADYYGAPEPVVTGQWRHGDVRHAWADPAPARDLLGFTSQVDLATGLNRLAGWIAG